MASCLRDVLSPAEIDKITSELHRNVRQALKLSEIHLRFAQQTKTSGKGAWRHIVSRGYYCCYCASRAARLAKTGVFSTESDDHKKIGDLPDAFPDRNTWADLLTKFRADRNLADYDHRVGANKLEYRPHEYLAKANDFLKQTREYLRGEGVL